jgi:hypothetical protein
MILDAYQMWGPDIPPGVDPSLKCRPLKMEAYSLRETGDVLKVWKNPNPAWMAYQGAHGLRSQRVEWRM